MRATLEYAFDETPEIGQALDVAAGVRWLRLPLPFMLAHINVWLLRDGDGWTLVDTGLFTGVTREAWRDIIDRHMDGLPLNRVVVTHLHPDHVGCAGWLARKFEVELWMSREEYLLCRILVADTGKPAPSAGIDFYRAAGFPDSALDRYMEHFGGFGRVVSPLPESYRRLAEGTVLAIGGRRWETVIGRGHSPEHACLLCREDNILIAGDQVLPTISSNVSVYPTEPVANPLLDWFDSLDRLADTLDPDVLVLPAHGKPFRGVHHRLDQLRDEHEEGLEKLRDLCREPRRALDVFPALFRSRIDERNLIMATGEALSHLHYLECLGEVEHRADDQGVNWYRLRQ